MCQDGTYRQWSRWRTCHADASRVAWEVDDNHPYLVPFARLDERGEMTERMNYYVRPPTSELVRCFPALLLPASLGYGGISRDFPEFEFAPTWTRSLLWSVSHKTWPSYLWECAPVWKPSVAHFVVGNTFRWQSGSPCLLSEEQFETLMVVVHIAIAVLWVLSGAIVLWVGLFRYGVFVYSDHCQISKMVGLAEMSRFGRCIVLLEWIVFSFHFCYHLAKAPTWWSNSPFLWSCLFRNLFTSLLNVLVKFGLRVGYEYVTIANRMTI